MKEQSTKSSSVHGRDVACELLPIGIIPWSIGDEAFAALISLTADATGDPGWRDLYRMAGETGDARMAQIALANIMGGLAGEGRYMEAEACARRQLAWAVGTGDPLSTGHALMGIAASRWGLGDAWGTVAAAQHALRLADVAERGEASASGFAGPSTIRSAARGQLNMVRMARGELRRTRSEQVAALELHRRSGDTMALASALEAMGVLAKSMGRYAEALEWFEEATREIQPLEPRLRDAIRVGLLGNSAVTLTWLGDTESALRHARESRRLSEQIGDPIGVIASLGQEARCHLRANLPESAIPLLRDMAERSEAAGAAGWRKAAYSNLATALLALGRRTAAIASCEVACGLSASALGHTSLEDWWLRVDVVNPATGPALPGEVRGEARLCLALAGFAVEAMQAEQRLAQPSAVAERWIGEMESVTELAFSHEAAVLDVPGPLEFEEPLRTLAAVAAQSQFQGWELQDVGFYCAECLRAQEFREQLRLSDAELSLPGGRSPLDSLEMSTDDIAPYRLPVRLAELKAALFDDELFLEYVLTGQAGRRQEFRGRKWTPSPARTAAPAFAVAVMRGWSAVVRLGSTSELESAVRSFLDRVVNPDTVVSPSALELGSAYLYELLLGPVIAAAGSLALGVRRVTVSPDGALNGLPFDLLAVERRKPSEWRETAWLGERWAVSVTPSGTVLTETRAGTRVLPPRGAAFVGFGDPAYAPTVDAERAPAGDADVADAEPLSSLPGSGREVEAISRVFRSSGCSKEDVVTLFSSDATKFNLTPELLQRAGYLHLSCHGTAGKGVHPDGALYLAAADSSDSGVLTAGEIAQLQTGARLVVMSACETARGVLARGEGVQGMVRAWLFAGAESVIASVWEVDDESTTLLMEELYRQLLEGASTRQALAAAKRQLIADSRWGHPSYWAAFVLVADAEERRASARAPVTLNEPALASRMALDCEGPPSETIAAISACASAWDSRSKGKALAFQTFLDAARKLEGRKVSHPDTRLLVSCVARACETVRREEAIAGRYAAAVAAYYTGLGLGAGTRTSVGWDELAKAYSGANRALLKGLAASGEVRRDYVLRLGHDFQAILETTTSRSSSIVGVHRDPEDVLISLPFEDREFSCTAPATACAEASQLVFALSRSHEVAVTEQLAKAFLAMPGQPDGVRLYASTWGSTCFRTTLTLLLSPDQVLVTCQLQSVRGPLPHTWIVSTPQGLQIMIGDRSDVAWLAKVAILVRSMPGASEFLTRSDLPFTSGMTVAQYEALFAGTARSRR